MLVVGLTGSIGMGKSTIAQRFRETGIAVFDADAEVHRLYAAEAVPFIEAAFPGTTKDGQVDRDKLAAVLIAAPHRFAELEAVVHPMVQAAERAFLRAEAARGARLAVLEVPLLFATGTDAKVDVVIVASATREVQQARVLARAGMTPDKLDRLLERQVPDAEQRQRADFVVDTSGTFAENNAQIDAIIARLEGRSGGAYNRHWA